MFNSESFEDIANKMSKAHDSKVISCLLTSSNFVFQSELNYMDDSFLCCYKPRRGEKPLWDFPQGTLSFREVASFKLSQFLGWNLIPPTILFEGEYGLGSFQLWIEESKKFNNVVELNSKIPNTYIPIVSTLSDNSERLTLSHLDNREVFKLAVFDYLINNADRKGGHVLSAYDKCFGIDNGLSFHHELKLRTVLWGFNDVELDDELVSDISRIIEWDFKGLTELLSESEINATILRAKFLIDNRILPNLQDISDLPWPLM